MDDPLPCRRGNGGSVGVYSVCASNINDPILSNYPTATLTMSSLIRTSALSSTLVHPRLAVDCAGSCDIQSNNWSLSME
jgi:hypothetical protein